MCSRFFLSACIILTLCLHLASVVLAENDQVRRLPTDIELKAALLSEFGKFVGWPPKRFPEKTTKVEFAILGDDPFGDFMEKLLSGKLIGERDVHIKRIQKLEDMGLVHVLFISSSEKGRLASLLKQLETQPILTVSDIDGFTKAGGMIGLFLSDKSQIRFMINVTSAKQAGLEIDNELLNRAEK